MNREYASQAARLYKIRCGLVHNAVLGYCFMTSKDSQIHRHLKIEGKCIVVHTTKLYDDFVSCFSDLESEFQSNRKLFDVANDRLIIDHEAVFSIDPNTATTPSKATFGEDEWFK